jgi:hypothetical protein
MDSEVRRQVRLCFSCFFRVIGGGGVGYFDSRGLLGCSGIRAYSIKSAARSLTRSHSLALWDRENEHECEYE